MQLIESKKELNFDALRYAAEQVRGSFTFTVLDSTNTLYIIKGDNPLHLIHFPTLGFYVYTSTREIMNVAFRQMPVRFPQYEVITVNEGELLRISADGTIERDRFTMHDDYTYFGRWYNSSLYNWEKALPTTCSEDSDYLILIELSGYYGVDPEDIRYMREMGYSYDEIEDMLVNPECYGAEFALAEL